jgi:hypothetical protein
MRGRDRNRQGGQGTISMDQATPSAVSSYQRIHFTSLETLEYLSLYTTSLSVVNCQHGEIDTEQSVHSNSIDTEQSVHRNSGDRLVA